MAFQSIDFLVHLTFLLIILNILPYKYRKLFLLCFCYYFYFRFNYIYVLFLLVSTLVNYFIALRISKIEIYWGKRIWIIIGILVSSTLLLNFKIESKFGIDLLFRNLSIENAVGTLVPIGISFYTFQTIGYLIDVYKGRMKAETNLINFALFVSYFPQVLAGPIERARNLLPQLKDTIILKRENLIAGAKLFLWGVFKKVLVADKLSIIANPIFDDTLSFSGLQVVIGVIAFSFQLYCDFSGYCEMALGISKALGIDLSVNFYHPYSASSLRDFWQRWHMTFTNWLRVYIYTPLGGSKVSTLKWIINLLMIFCLSGLWHGIAITFLTWAGLHFIFFLIERLVYDNFKIENKIPRIIRQIIVFSFVTFAWIFFRSPNLSTAFTVIEQMFHTQANGSNFEFSSGLFNYGDIIKLNIVQILSIIVPFLTYIVFELFGLTYAYFKEFDSRKINYVEIIFLNLLVVYSLFFIVEPSQQFIYFKF